MEYRSLLRNIIAALVGIVLVVLVIVLIVKAITGLTRSSGIATTQFDVTKYAGSGSSVTLFVDGATNSDQDHRQSEITVSADAVQIKTMQGYQGTVLDMRTYQNNSAAYGAFLQSLKEAGFTKKSAAKLNDYRGYCPLGKRYVFTFNDGNTDRYTSWMTNCGDGNYKGLRTTVVNLFRAQIPQADYYHITDIAQASLSY